MKFPQHHFKPEDLLTFIETRPFTAIWKRLGLNDDDLHALQIAIMCRPKGAPVMEGTGGLRKIRFAPEGRAKGKSGALRICFAYFERFHTVVLALVYTKDVQENLTPEQSKILVGLVKEIEKDLDR